MSTWLYKWLPIIFGCHCRDDRSFHYRGKKFPICARCTGELVGILILLISCPFYLPSGWVSGISCEDGEVAASVFDRYRTPLYKQASFKPYIIAAMIFLAKVKNPQATLKALEERSVARFFQK